MANTVYTTNPDGFSFVNTDGLAPRLYWGKAAAACKAGDLLIWDGNGRLAKHTAAGAETIVGVAQNECTAADEELSYIPALPNYVFEAEYVVASADINALRGVAKEVVGTTGVMGVGALVANPVVRIIDWAPDYNPGIGNTTSYGRVWVQIYKSVYNQA